MSAVSTRTRRSFIKKLVTSAVMQGEAMEETESMVVDESTADGIVVPDFDEGEVKSTVIECLSSLKIAEDYDSLEDFIRCALLEEDAAKDLIEFEEAELDEFEKAELDDEMWLHGFTLVSGKSLRLYHEDSRRFEYYHGDQNEEEDDTILTILRLSESRGWVVLNQ